MNYHLPDFLSPPQKPEPDPEWKNAVTLDQAIARGKAAGEDVSSLEYWQDRLRAKPVVTEGVPTHV